jgi:putative ABC transport system permease protein
MHLLMFLGQLWRDVRSQKFRTLMTVFGIIWGTTAIILLLAFGQGLHRNVAVQSKALGERIAICWPSRTSKPFEGLKRGRPIRVKAEEVLLLKEEIPGIELASPEYTDWSAQVRYSDKILNKRLHGVSPDYGPMRWCVAEMGGRFINAMDIENKRRVVFIGDQLKNELFGSQDAIGEYVVAEGIPFLVIGVLRHKEQDSSYSGRDEEKMFIPWTTFEAMYGRQYVNNFVYKPRQGVDGEKVKDAMYEFYGRRFRFDPEDRESIMVWDTSEMEKMFNALFYGMRIFLGIVGSFTLIVGGIGVSNIMNVVIEERTREIGVKMALGAKRRYILWQFVAETLTITIAGGAIGFVISWFIVTVFPAFNLEEYVGVPKVSTSVAVAAAGLLCLVGLVSGFFPARRAASLQPVQALKP